MFIISHYIYKLSFNKNSSYEMKTNLTGLHLCIAKKIAKIDIWFQQTAAGGWLEMWVSVIHEFLNWS